MAALIEVLPRVPRYEKEQHDYLMTIIFKEVVCTYREIKFCVIDLTLCLKLQPLQQTV